MSRMVCPNPQHVGCTLGDKFCCKCGRALIPSLESKCGSCGASVYSGDVYCGKCGEVIVR